MKGLNSELYDLTHGPHYSLHNKNFRTLFPFLFLFLIRLVISVVFFFCCCFCFTFPFVWGVILRADVGRQDDTWNHDYDVKSAKINKGFFLSESS